MSTILTLLQANASQMLNTWFTMQLQMAGFVLLVWLLERALPAKWSTPRLRYLLWSTVLLKALIPPVISMPGAEALPSAAFNLAPVEVLAPGAFSVVPAGMSFASILMLAIIACSLTLAGIALWRAVSLRRVLRAAQPFTAVPAGDWPPIFVSDRIPSPLATGIRHPRIYITSAIAQAQPEILDAVLQHERAHIRRRDAVSVVLQTMVQIVYVLNPLMWMANLRIFRYRELICDEEALSTGGTRPQEYGRLLIDFAEAQPARILQTGTCFFETRRGFVQRISELFNTGNRSAMQWKHYALVVAFSLAILPLSWRCGDNAPREADVKLPMKSESVLPDSMQNYDPNHDTNAEIIGGLDALREQIKYPDEAKAKNLEGTVVVKVVVEKDGSATGFEVARSVDPILAKSAIKAVQGVRFKPSMYKGEPRQSTISIPIKFRLK